MSSSQHPAPGFFPNLLSVVVFVIILSGVFFGFTRMYPLLIARYQSQTPPEVVKEPPDASEEIAPFVRGIISGMTASQRASMRSNAPLNVTQIKGYESGIKTALLASKNWYNLDQQLFRVRGISAGVMAAEQSSKTERERGSQAYQLRLIQQIQSALEINLEELLAANSNRREQVLQDYLDNLKKLAAEAAIESANMQRVIEEAQTEAELQTGIAEEYDENFIYTLEPTDDKGLEAYLRARNQLDQASVTIRSTGQLLNRLGPLNLQLNQLITAIEANFQALAGGIRVAPTQGVNLPIFQEQ
ncbi:MAG: hypothetical protein AB7J40_02135 [Candidatus Altimarinota bacterium]